MEVELGQLGIRGGIIVSMTQYVKNHDRNLYAKILQEMTEPAQQTIEAIKILKNYYPLSHYEEFLDRYRKKASPEEFKNSARAMAESDLKGMLLIFVRMLSIDFIIKKVSQLHSMYYTHGDMQVISSDEEKSGVAIVGLPMHEAHRIHTEEYMRVFLERASKKKYKSQSQRINLNRNEFWFFAENQ